MTNASPVNFAALLGCIRRAHSILLITHISPDSDAIGGLLGLTHALRRIDKTVTPSCSDPIYARFNLLPGDAEVVSRVDGAFELAIALDCGDEGRLGQIWIERPAPKPFLINVDHHITNTRFGQINWVDPSAASTSELVLDLIDRLDIPLDRDIATCLLYGIVGDTLGFRTSNTTPQVLRMAQRLMDAGASLFDSMNHQFNRRSLALICLWGKGISALKITDRIVYTAIGKPLRDACGMSNTGDISLASFLIGANEADRAAVLVERDDGQIEISLRAKVGFNVAAAAAALGGGGHRLAAGATIAGPLEHATQRVLEALRQNT